MKRMMLLGFSLFLVAAFGEAAARRTVARGLYRIDLTNGTAVFATNPPARQGTVIVFRESESGRWTGVPAELVVRIEGGDSTARAGARAPLGGVAVVPAGTLPSDALDVVARPLQPGDVLVLGPTGEGGGAATAVGGSMGAPSASATPGVPTGAYGYGGNANVPGNFSSNGLPLAPSSTDLARAQSGGQTVGANGFPASPGSLTTIGPDGTPTLAPGSAEPIGPNGFPIPATAGTAPLPGANTPLGPNGFPTTPGTMTAPPGTNQPLGPNGFPIPAPAGAPVQPGANAPVGPNGFPAAPPPASPPR